MKKKIVLRTGHNPEMLLDAGWRNPSLCDTYPAPWQVCTPELGHSKDGRRWSTDINVYAEFFALWYPLKGCFHAVWRQRPLTYLGLHQSTRGDKWKRFQESAPSSPCIPVAVLSCSSLLMCADPAASWWWQQGWRRWWGPLGRAVQKMSVAASDERRMWKEGEVPISWM